MFRPLDSWRNSDTAAKYGEYVTRHWMYSDTSRDLVERVGPIADGVVLDLACGTGASTRSLLEHVGPSVRVIALDGSGEMLGVARDTTDDPRVEWVEAEAETVGALGLPPLDVAVCNSAFWQFDMARTLEGLATALKPGGRLAFNIGAPFLFGLGPPPRRRKPSLLELMAAIAVIDHDWVPQRLGPPPFRGDGALTPERVEGMLTDAGFALESFERVEFPSSIESERAWLSIPIFTEASFAGLTYGQRMDCLATAYGRVDPESVLPSVWGVFVARRTPQR